MKRISAGTLTSLVIAGLSASVLFADTTPITAGLNAPAIDYTGGAQVIWGPLVSQSFLEMSGSANNNYPQKIVGSYISGNGGSAGARNYCVGNSVPASGPGTIIPPSSVPVYEWFCNYPAPPAPQVNFDDYKYLAQSQGNSCGGQPCYNTSSNPSFSGINDPTCTVNGQPKVWFFEGSPKFSGGTYFCGVVVSRGSVGFTGSGTGVIAATPPSNAWQQYEVATPNGPAGSGDTSAVDQYPGDAGLHSVKPYTISSGVTFKGYIYATTGYSGGGGTVILGSVQFGAGAASSSGGGTIYFQPTTIFSPPPTNTVNAPIITPPGGNFISPVQVTIADTTPGAAIHYTVDGTAPNSSSPLYAGPFTLSTNTTVKAIGTLAGLTDSAVTTAVFTFGPGGGGSNPAPILTSLIPNTKPEGSPSFSMTVNGSQFVNGAVVSWNGVNLATSFTNATSLTATVPATNVLTAGTANVQVTNPDGQKSGVLPFTITSNTTPPSPAPILSSLNPNTMAAGSPNFVLTVFGSNFINGAVVTWNGANLVTNSLSSTQLTADVPAANVLAPGTANVRVVNPDLQASGSLPFTITAAPPHLDHILVSPSSATVGVGVTMTFTAQGIDQYNAVMNGLVFDWAVTGPNTVAPASGSSSTDFTAGSVPGTYRITATNGAISGQAVIAVQGGGVSGGLFLVDPATATPNPVAGVMTHLHVLAQSTNPGPISYDWDYNGLAAVIASPTTHDTDVTFTQPGTYQFNVTMTDSQGLKLYSGVSVIVLQTVTRVVVSPAQAITSIGTPYTFSAQAFDQWNNPITAPLTWSALGSVNSSAPGTFSALAPVNNVTIKAAATNGVFGTALLTVQGAAAGSVDLSAAKAYPVPYKSTSGTPGVTFTGLTAGTTIKIFSTDGHLVQTLHSDGSNVLWPVNNKNGEKVSSGVYFYRIDNGAQKKEGKVVIIQ